MELLLRIPPPVYALTLLGLAAGLEQTLPLPVNLALPYLGMALALAGLGLAVSAWWPFYRFKTTPIPTGVPRALVRDGPYRHTRNPMYLGVLSVLLGVVFYLGSPYYLLSAAGFFLVVDKLFVPYEEAKLEHLFGDDYVRFKHNVGRWW